MIPIRVWGLLLFITAPLLGVAADPTIDPRYLGGMWQSEHFMFLIANTPKLPRTQKMVDRYAAAIKNGQIIYTAWTSCRPGAISGMAMAMNSIAVLQADKDITISLEEPRMTRRIRLDAKHPGAIVPSYLGDSVGHWDGNTLVVDTIGFNGDFELDAAAQPTSKQLHTVERFTKSADGKRIAVEITITDPVYYRAPFKIERDWVIGSRRHQFEYDCMENPRSEEFSHTLFVKELYRPTCVSYQGAGREHSHMYCGADQHYEESKK